MNKPAPTIIRLSVTKEVQKALTIAQKRYPALSDPELLKLGLSKIATEHGTERTTENTRAEIRASTAQAVGKDYLEDENENIYTASMGKSKHSS